MSLPPFSKNAAYGRIPLAGGTFERLLFDWASRLAAGWVADAAGQLQFQLPMACILWPVLGCSCPRAVACSAPSPSARCRYNPVR